jgi:hypothetical protein
MVTTTPVDQLIARLKALQLETSRTIELLELARGEESQRQLALEADRRPTTPTNRSSIGITTPVATLIVEDSTIANANDNDYRIGDRVTITNATKGNHDRRATVTRVTNGRVCVRTNDNQKTWRAPKNLRLESRR